MANGKFITYTRVSTARQGVSGLGFAAQQEAVKRFLVGGAWERVGEFQEIETGKGAGALAKRPQLRAALEACRKQGATLLIAKLDRLARNVHFVSGLMESRVKFVACDMPEANELTIHIMAAFAEHEAKRISQRTKDALAMAKARGTRLGVAGSANLRPNLESRKQAANDNATKVKPVFDGMKARGLSQRKMSEELNSVGVPSPRGGTWSQVQIQRLLKRLNTLQASQYPPVGS